MTDDKELEALRAKRLAELRSLAETQAQAGDADGSVHSLDDATFGDFVARNRLVFVDFWAPWCAPCRMVAPSVEALAAEFRGRVAFAKVDTDQSPRTAQAFGVQSIPFLVMFRNGRAVDGVVGAQPRAALRAAIQPYL